MQELLHEPADVSRLDPARELMELRLRDLPRVHVRRRRDAEPGKGRQPEGGGRHRRTISPGKHSRRIFWVRKKFNSFPVVAISVGPDELAER